MANRKTVQLSPVKYTNSLKRFVVVIFLLLFIRLYSSFGQNFRKGQRLVYVLKSSYLSAGGDILRFKRAIFTIGPAVIRGMKATTKLLRKAKQIPSGTKHMSAGDVTVEFRQFVKPGNYDTAMKDFFSVKPTGVQEFELPKQYKGLMGMIGDREISITDKDIIEGSPIMMILQTLPSGKHRIDRIIYHSE